MKKSDMGKIDRAFMLAAPYAVLAVGAFLTYASRGTVGGEKTDIQATGVGLYLMAMGALGLWMQHIDGKKKDDNNQKSR